MTSSEPATGAATTTPTATATTYRYLRLGMVGLLLMLGVAVVVAHQQDPRGCWQTSISAYYFTPARAVLVATLTAIGFAMVSLKGSTEVEDVVLNLGGMLAPVVAFVPTSDTGPCATREADPALIAENVTNNLAALLAALGVGVVFVLLLAVRALFRRRVAPLVGALLSGALVAGFAWWLYADRPGLVEHGHDVAAVGLFAAITLVAVLNARGLGRSRAGRRAYLNRYAVIAVLMVVVPAGLLGYDLVVGWEHALLWVEVVMLGLFAVFWLTQTRELWSRGLR